MSDTDTVEEVRIAEFDGQNREVSIDTLHA